MMRKLIVALLVVTGAAIQVEAFIAESTRALPETDGRAVFLGSN